MNLFKINVQNIKYLNICGIGGIFFPGNKTF